MARVGIHLSVTQCNATWVRLRVVPACSGGGSTSSYRSCTRYRSFRTCAYASCLFDGWLGSLWVIQEVDAEMGGYYITNKLVNQESIKEASVPCWVSRQGHNPGIREGDLHLYIEM